MLRPTLLLTLCFFTLRSDLAGQVLNMSHQLVSLGIAARNLTPNTPTLDARPLIQAAAQYAVNNSYATLTLDQGNYYLLTSQQSNAVLLFHASNLTIDFAGSTLYFVGPLLANGLQLYECSNVTLTNLRTDFLNPPYTHVQLTSVDTTNRVLHYQTLPGWPDPSTFNNLVSPFGDTIANWAAIFRNGAIVPGTTRTLLARPFLNSALTVVDQGPWAQAATLATLRPGDTVVVTARDAGPPILVWKGDSNTVSNTSVYGSGDWAVEFYNTSNSTAQNVRVEPRPGTGLIGSNADGIHFTSMLQNNRIVNCYVSATLDDALAMDSMYVGTVTSQNGSFQATVTRFQYSLYPTGALMNFVDPNTTSEITGAHVVSQSPPYSDSPNFGETVVLTFDQALPSLSAGMGMVYGDPNNRGQGSVIEDSTVQNTYGGHGIWLTGLQGVTARRNVLRQTSMAGIGLESTTDPNGYPGPGETNILLDSNALEGNLGPAACGTGVQDCMGAITSVITNNQGFAFAAQSSNQNITVANNYISDSSRSGIWFAEVNGATLQNNLILRYSQNPTMNGVFGIPTLPLDTQVMQDALAPLVTHYSQNITQTGNTIAATSPVIAPVAMSPAAVTLPATPFTGNFAVQPVIAAFDWAPASDSPWLTVTSGVGPGAGTVQYQLAANATGATRTGHVVVAGETFIVTQTTASSFSACDVLKNGNIGVADVQLLISESLGLSAGSDDLDRDGVVNVVDIQIEINAALGSSCAAH